MVKKYIETNVYDATNERLEFIFNEFDNVLVSFSGGKDSGIVLNMAYEYAKEHDLLHKLSMYYMDYEINYEESEKYLKQCFEDDYKEIEKKYWLCLPISAQCAVSMYQTYWIPWNKDEKEKWVKDFPDNDYVVNEDNIWWDFEKGDYGGDTRKEFTKAFASKYGKTAVLVGLRSDESLSRLGTITSQHRVNMYKGRRYSTVQNEETVNFYPIYDWITEDVWIANGKFGWTYNKTYDLMYQAGMSIHMMRLASPFHSSGQASLKLYKVLNPDTWGKMISRVNGVNFTGIYGGTTAMGWNNIEKPEHFTWEEYAKFLIKTLPDDFRERITSNIERIMDTWENEGYGRNPTVIKTMEEEGVILEKTGVESKICTKDNYYEIVKIKNGMPDETSIPMFRKVPSWKGVCITILKNDVTCQYMGCSRTKEDMSKRRKAMKKYAEIL